MGCFWGRCEAGPRGRGGTGMNVPGFFGRFFFGVLCALAFLPSTANPTAALTLAPLSDWGQGARGEGRGADQGTVGHALFSSLLPVLPRTALLPQPHPRQSALLGPIRIEALALCRIFPEGLRSSVGLLSRVWQVAWGFWACLARALHSPPPPFFVRGFSPICET